MTNAEIRMQDMYEIQCERIWEQMNMSEPSESKMVKAAKSLSEAVRLLDNACDWTADAAQILKGTTMEDRLISFADDIEALMVDLREIERKYKRGVA